MDFMNDTHFKVCNPTLYATILETYGDQFVGIFSPIANLYLEIIGRILKKSPKIDPNYPGIGNEIGNSELYGGCLSQLQRGESDIIVHGIDYPIDMVNITQEVILFDEKIGFIGAFPRPTANKIADLSRSIHTFNWSVYLLILIFLVSLTVFFKIRLLILKPMIRSTLSTLETSKLKSKLFRQLTRHQKIRLKSTKITFCDVFRHFLTSHFIESKSFVVKYITISITLFSFFTFAHYNSALNTELVVPESVIIYENYEQLMKDNVKPVFLLGTSYFREFKYAPEGSRGRIYWDWAVDKFGEENLFVEINLQSMAIAAEIMQRQVTAIAGSLILEQLKSTGCEFLGRPFDQTISVLNIFRPLRFDFRKFSDAQAYIRSDESAKERTKAFIFGKRISQSKILPNIIRNFRRILEFGHIINSQKSVREMFLFDLSPDFSTFYGKLVPERSEIKRICKDHNSPHPKTPVIDHVKPSHLKISFITFFILLCFAFIRLSFELLA